MSEELLSSALGHPVLPQGELLAQLLLVGFDQSRGCFMHFPSIADSVRYAVGEFSQPGVRIKYRASIDEQSFDIDTVKRPIVDLFAKGS